MGLNVIMMGPPGAGKGTQALRFAEGRGLPKISTGDILREAIKAHHPTGLAAKARIDRGELVDDATMIQIVADRLGRADVNAGFVLDGFPRTVAQARALDELVERLGLGPLIVVDVVVPDHEIVRRLGSRRICGGCGNDAAPARLAETCEACGEPLVQRTDDDELVVRERLRIYEQSTRPVLEFYRARPTFRVVNGAQAPEHVARDLDAVIGDAATARA